MLHIIASRTYNTLITWIIAYISLQNNHWIVFQYIHECFYIYPHARIFQSDHLQLKAKHYIKTQVWELCTYIYMYRGRSGGYLDTGIGEVYNGPTRPKLAGSWPMWFTDWSAQFMVTRKR